VGTFINTTSLPHSSALYGRSSRYEERFGRSNVSQQRQPLTQMPPEYIKGILFPLVLLLQYHPHHS